jgi:hypothetical protein
MRGPPEQTGRRDRRAKKRAAVSSGRFEVYRDFGVVSSLLVLAPGADELPEPVVCLMALAWFRCM